MKSPEPVFRPSAANGVWGTGHNGFTTSPDGREDWLIYHTKAAADGKYEGRGTRAQPFGWRAQLWRASGVAHAATGAFEEMP